MTLPRLYAITDYWKSAPPVNESVAAYLGIKPEPAAPSASGTAPAPPPDVMAMIRSAPIALARGPHG